MPWYGSAAFSQPDFFHGDSPLGGLTSCVRYAMMKSEISSLLLIFLKGNADYDKIFIWLLELQLNPHVHA